MAQRYPHWQYPSRGDGQPKRLVALAVLTRAEPIPGRAVAERDVLVGWAARGSDRNTRGQEVAWQKEGDDVDGLWRAVRWACSRGGVTWCVSLGAAYAWTVLGLWPRLEAGTITLAGVDSHDLDGTTRRPRMSGVRSARGDAEPGRRRYPDDRVRSVSARRTGKRLDPPAAGQSRATPGGLAILEDPPTVVDLRWPGLPGRFRIADIRNWGLDVATPGDTALSRVGPIWGALTGMIGELRRRGWGSLQVTAASQAVGVYRRACLTTPMHLHTDQDALALEEAALFGGRCECRRIGECPGLAYLVDYRSHYGAVMRDEVVPVALHEWGTGGPKVSAGPPGTTTGLIAEVTVRSEEPAYPRRSGDLTLYPVGRWRTTLAGPELQDALEHGRVVTWHRWAAYLLAPALRQYATAVLAALQDAREALDGPRIGWLKALLVSLPGKLAARSWSWVDWPRQWPDGPWTRWRGKGPDGQPCWIRALGWQVQYQRGGGWARQAMPAAAAWVTSWGRLRLLGAIRAAGWSHVHYYDTDSLIVDALGYAGLLAAGLIGSGEPGRLRLQEAAGHAHVRGIKSYTIGGKSACSGLPRGQTAAGPAEGTFWHSAGLAEAATKGEAPQPVRRLRCLSRTTRYQHGAVGADGVVLPPEIWEE